MEVPLSLQNTENARRTDPSKKCLADFKVEKEIGEGSFSTVYLAREKSREMREVALKVCLKKHIVKNRMVIYVQREKEALAILSMEENKHPGIIGIYCTFQDAESLYFVLSYAKYGDLWNLMRKQPNKRFTVKDAQYYSANLLSALDHIHKHGIIHRDVKTENLLVQEDGRILLSDFGSSKFLKDYETQPPVSDKNQNTEEERPGRARRASFTGTAQFCTPELLEGQRTDPATDIWAFGVVIYNFLTGILPFEDISEYLIFRRVQAVLYDFPEDFPDENAKDLVERVLVKKKEDRLTSEQLMAHKFFESIDFEKLQEMEPPKIFLNLEDS
ncbi:hypothetical protein CAEBREN_01183 [Caenorhabditis brenneri]|uniref:non-specific serine/threonine protein kinase n=1 Tax=Caenorhabditis brenneri TaxID=135651 RepID=G0P492_CAEBE|nr:hypothetical protein CAEBREN_01183 [Caenorhabditis brenneri]